MFSIIRKMISVLFSNLYCVNKAMLIGIAAVYVIGLFT